MRSTTKATVAKARRLRRKMSKPEAALWRVLRKHPSELKFRRQHPFGPYVIDFYCPSAKTGIEIDGIAHERGDNPARDERRDRWIKGRGLRMLRVPAAQVLGNIQGVVDHIVEHCLSSPSPRDGEGDRPKDGGGA